MQVESESNSQLLVNFLASRDFVPVPELIKLS